MQMPKNNHVDFLDAYALLADGTIEPMQSEDGTQQIVYIDLDHKPYMDRPFMHPQFGLMYRQTRILRTGNDRRLLELDKRYKVRKEGIKDGKV